MFQLILWLSFRKTRQDIFQPMIRLMNHALGILEDDISPSSMERRFQKGWPSLFETNPRLWREYPDEYLLFIDVPGIPRQDLSVAISKSQVIVKGRHGSCIRPSKSKIGKEVDRLCLDRKIEEYLRIPEDVDQSKIECKFKEGVLIVRMPKIGEGDLQKSVRVDEYVPSWSEMAMEAKESVMGKFGWSHGTQDS